MKRVFQSRRELIAYIAFGAITIAVGLPIYLAVFEVAEHLLHIPLDDKTTSTYTAVYIAAQVIKWIVTVLVTFYTNRKWVFHSRGPLKKQFLLFSSSRLVTFFLDLIATYFVIQVISLWMPPESIPSLLGIPLTAELWAKILVAVLVIILNYFISKLLIFRKQRA